jgi:hypothetical protein
MGGQDSANNYSILKFVVGTAPITLSYEVTWNTGKVYSLRYLDSLNYFAGGFDTQGTTYKHGIISKYTDASATSTSVPTSVHLSWS